MAVTWGPAAGGDNQMRLGFDFRQSPSTVAAGTSSVTLWLDIWVWTRWGVSDSSNTFSVQGTSTLDSTTDVTIATSVSSGPGWAEENKRLVRTVSRVFAPSHDAPTVSEFTATLSGVEAVGASRQAAVSGSHTTARRPHTAPSAPTGVAASRVSDGHVNVSWTRHATAAAPYTGCELRRQESPSGPWTTIRTGLGAVSSFADTTTVADREYRYRLHVTNTGGSATSAASAPVWTTPRAPSGLTAARGPAGSITLAWDDRASAEEGYRVYHSQGGAAPALLATLPAGTVSAVHAAPSPAHTHSYGVEAYRGALSSARVTSGTVTLLAPPAAPPPVTTPPVAAAGEDLPVSWTHSPLDTSPQSSYEVRHRPAGGAWSSTGRVTSSEGARVIPASALPAAPAVLEVSARTWGQHPDPSSWSASASVPLSARPAATVSHPPDGGQVGSPALQAAWLYHDPEGSPQSAWRCSLRAPGGQTLWTREGEGPASETPVDVLLADGAAYELAVSVRDGAGLWSGEALSLFSVAYEAPPAPEVSAAYSAADASVTVTIDNPAPGAGQIQTVSNTVSRESGGVVEVIAEGAGLNAAVIDRTPPLGAVSSYTAVARSAIGSAASSLPAALAVPAGGAVIVNFGPGLERTARLEAGLAMSGSVEPDRRYYQAAGRALPLMVSGEGVEETVTASGDLFSDAEGEAAFAALARETGEVVYRDPRGRRVRGGARVEMSEGAGPRVTRVSVEIRRTG